jgi:hypothetical protein
MQITRSRIQYLPTTILIVVGVFVWVLSSSDVATAFDFHADSAHGDPISGVNRLDAGHDIGDCAHCHDTFDDSICGVNQRMLFATQFANQRGGLCMRCHSSGAYCQQVDGLIINYDYSRTRGGEEGKDCPSNIRMAFKFINYETRLPPEPPQSNCDSSVGSAHDLANINAYMKGRWDWGDTNPEVNPCGTCHNPHQATKEYPCSLPSSHSETWEVWGDESGEKMVDYLDLEAGEFYQPPDKAGGGSERDADIQPNYVEFCLECHQDQQNSYQHGTVGGLGAGSGIDWTAGGSVHGKFHNGSHGQGSLKPPYTELADWENITFVLCCTDCHEPHGSRNEWLLRTEVNGTIVEINAAGDWWGFCTACHELNCVGCRHDPAGGDFTGRPCNDLDCHTHGHPSTF